jgi:hypothetical protein
MRIVGRCECVADLGCDAAAACHENGSAVALILAADGVEEAEFQVTDFGGFVSLLGRGRATAGLVVAVA